MSQTANQRLLKQLEAPPPKIEQPASYAFSVLLSLMVALLLSLVYLGVLLGMLWLAVRLTIGAVGLLMSGSVILAVLMGIVALIALTLFFGLTKPFGLAFATRPDHITLDREAEPFLYDYVDRICQTLDTPKPMEIRVDLAPNASAGPASFVEGFYRQNLVLTIGLPLALGLNVQQFSGVIAHELGHFAQSGGGTDLSHILRLVNASFDRIVRGEDWFDRLLDQQGALGKLLIPFRFCNYVTRRFFFLLMLAGHASSSFETRQKEFDADAYETYLAGHEAFRHCSRNLELLGAGYHSAMNDLEEAWQDRRLMDNLPALAIANTTQMPKQRQRQLYRLSLTRKTQWHDSHPSHAERLRASHQLGYAGLVNDQRPARALFQGIHRICREATVNMLRDRLGDDFNEAKLVPAGQFLREHEETQKAYRALRHFYLGKFLIWRPLFPFPIAAKAPKDPRETLDTIEQRRNAMALHAQQASDWLSELDQIDNRRILARQAQSVVELGYRINPSDFELKGGHRDHIDYVLKDINRTAERIEKSLMEYDLHARWRLTHALQLLHIKRTYNRLDEQTRDTDRRQAVKLIGLCPLLQETQKKFAALRATIHVVAPLIPCVDPNNPDPRLIQNVLIQCRQSAKQLGEALEPLTSVTYPFDHAEGHISIAKAIAERTPDPESPIDVISTSLMIFERFDSLLARVLARLARIAEKVETALELPKLKQLTERDEVEEFVRKCEEEAREPKGFESVAVAMTRWAAQIGITLGLVLVLVIGFWLFASLATSDMSLANGNDRRSTPTIEEVSPHGPGDRSNPIRRLHGDYKIVVPPQFKLISSNATHNGDDWDLQYVWQHEQSSNVSIVLKIERREDYLRGSRPRITNRVPDNYQAPVVRVDNTYYIRGSRPANMSTPHFRFTFSRYRSEGRQGSLFVGFDYDRLIEIRTEYPQSTATFEQSFMETVHSFQPPENSRRTIDPP